MRFDDCLQYVGEFGPFQRTQIAMLGLVHFTAGVHIMMTVFTLDVPNHRCAAPWLENDTYSSEISSGDYNLGKCTIEFNYALGNMTTARDSDLDGSNHTSIHRCTRWVYDTSVFTSTIVTQVNFVCGRELFKSHLLMLLMVGQLIGSFLGGTADIFGRKKLLIGGLLVHMLVSVLTTLADSITALGAAYLINGTAIGTAYCCSFMLALEQVGARWRHVTGVGATGFWWCAGMFWVCLLAFFIRDWRTLQLVASVPSVLFVLFICLVYESPRWLAGKGRYSEAEAILDRMARRNGKQLPPTFDLSSCHSETPQNQGHSVWALRRYPRLLVRAAIVFIQWSNCSLTYYGLGLNVGQLSGDIFLNFCLAAAFELAAYIAILVLLSRVGRKPLYCYALLFGGLCCLLTVVPVMVGGPWEAWAVRGLAMMGKFGVAGAYGVIWLFTPELFPTSLRVSITGASSCFARIGGVAASYLATMTLPGKVGQLLPQIIFGCLAVMAGSLALTLPETKEADLPDSMADALEMKRSDSKPEKQPVQDALLL